MIPCNDATDSESRHVHMIQNLIATLNLGKNIA